MANGSARSGGGEIIDQGMHLLDLSYWLLGELPVRSSLLKTQFWRAPVDDNAVMILADSGGSATIALGLAPRELDRVEEHVLHGDHL